MEKQFIQTNFDKKNLLKNDNNDINQFLLENNSKQVEQIFDFFNSDISLLLINGFLGTGKTSVLNYVLKIAINSIVIKYDCFETTILDDILLTFFNEFKNLSNQGKIIPPKAKFDNFTQKINAFFEVNTMPITIVINSFSAILKRNQTDIIAFIKHLCSLTNLKVIIVSRAIDYNDFDIDYKKVTTLALTKSLFEKYLRAEDFKQIGPLSDELYKVTRGYFFYITLSIKIMSIKGYDFIQFLDKHSKSFLSFNDFVLREALTLVDPVSGHLFRFLTIIRHPVNVKLLKTLNLYNETKVNYFLENLLLSKTNNSLYLKDYYKEIAENSIPQNIVIKLHQGCVDLYNTQLPLKPAERSLQISRQTMRNEIEYHNMFIPQKPTIDIKIPKINNEIEEVPKQEEIIEDPIQEKIENMSFIFDDGGEILDKIADSITGYISYNDKKMKEYKEETKLSYAELLTYAQKEEKNFNYKHAISLYLKALAKKDDEEYYTNLPKIYTQLGFAYQNSSDWFNAEKYFKMSEDFYTSIGETEQVNEHKFYIANIYFITFKKEKAKEILMELEKQDTTDKLKIKIYNALANLNTNSNIAYNYYQKALSFNTTELDKNILSEIYYKYALLNEDRADDEIAAQYYKKCINLKDTPYLSSAMTNLATLYDDLGESELAIKYYCESMEIDKDKKNFNGIYTSSMKLAEIFSAKNADKTIYYYNQAIEVAYELNEAFYIMSATTALGDYYFNKKEYESSYKNYIIAFDISQKSIYEENNKKIQRRIEDIKLKLGEERFNKIAR